MKNGMKSVVVPVAWYRGSPKGDDLEIGFECDGLVFDKEVWNPLYASAPAPSSLAGGEVTDDAILKAATDIRASSVAWANDPTEFAHLIELTPDEIRKLFAALYPEAPAREGGDWQPIETVPQDGTEIDLWGHWPEHDRWVRTPDAVWDAERCDWKVNGFYAGAYVYPPRFTHWRAVAGPDALTPRHEAPAEGAGEAHMGFLVDTDDGTEWVEDDPRTSGVPEHFENLRPLTLQAAKDEMLSAWEVRSELETEFRARSSALEAREVEAVAWTEDMERERREADYGRGFRHGKKSAFDDARSEPVAWRGRDLDAFGDGAWAVCSFKPSADKVEALYTHPAAPSADKLRIAVEALEEIADTDPDDGTSWFHERADKALAALKAEGA